MFKLLFGIFDAVLQLETRVIGVVKETTNEDLHSNMHRNK